jgi:hypothetical protein
MRQTEILRYDGKSFPVTLRPFRLRTEWKP